MSSSRALSVVSKAARAIRAPAAVTVSSVATCRTARGAVCQQQRSFGSGGVQNERESFPYQNPLAKILHPIGYIKWKMNRIDSARHAYENCAIQFERREDLVNALNIPNNFQTWFAMTVLHVWIYNARLRAEGVEGKEMKQEMFDHIWLDVEIKIHKAGVKSNFSKIMSNLVSAYYGQTLAYDEGLYYGDDILAGALWRNLCSSENVSAQQLEELTRYVRRQLQRIDEADRADVLEGRFTFDEVKV